MEPKNTTAKYRISVLMDSSKVSEILLTNAVGLAKAIHGTVEVFHVKPAINLVKRESQLSAMRSIREHDRNTRNQIQDMVNEIGQREELPISFRLAYGNVKNAIKKYLAERNPDILVMGKRKPALGIVRESITDFVMDESDTNVLILGEDHKLHTFSNLSLGVFGKGLQAKGLEIINDLKKDSDKPVRLFNIKNEKATEEDVNALKKTISYVFTEGTNALDGLVNYVSRTNTQLLCVPKDRSKGFTFQTSPTKQLVRKSNVPVLIMA